MNNLEQEHAPLCLKGKTLCLGEERIGRKCSWRGGPVPALEDGGGLRWDGGVGVGRSEKQDHRTCPRTGDGGEGEGGPDVTLSLWQGAPA